MKKIKENIEFKEHVTNIAFSLTLTKNMCWVLLTLRDSPASVYGGGYACFIPTVRRLQERGLVVHAWPAPKGKQPHTITKIGLTVCQLIEAAGLGIKNTKPSTVRKSA